MDRTLGGVLLAAGILIACGSGICSVMILSDIGGSRMWLMVAFFGGIPLVAGVLLIVGGRALLQAARRDWSDEA